VSGERASSANFVAGADGRRSIRLGGYDYSRSGAYFVTVCTLRRRSLFSGISHGMVIENGNVSIVRRCWLDLPDHYPHVSLDAFVMMPDHIHGIMVLADTNRAVLKPAPTGGGAGTYGGVRHGLPEIVRAFKTFSARRINARRDTPGVPVWQRGYHERIIRNERELNLTRKYITNNPRNVQTIREQNLTSHKHQHPLVGEGFKPSQ
jgi:putative transposase